MTKRYVLESDPGENLTWRLCTSQKLPRINEWLLLSCRIKMEKSLSLKGSKGSKALGTFGHKANIRVPVDLLAVERGSQNKGWASLIGPDVEARPWNFGARPGPTA